MPTELLLVGAGGHAKVVIEAIQESNFEIRIILVDQDSSKVAGNILGKIPIKSLQDWAALPELYHVAIGDNQVRQELSSIAKSNGKRLFTVVHPLAYVSSSAFLGDGCFVAAKAVVSSEAHIGENCIINHGAIVDHENRVGNCSHIAPNVTLGGGVEIGSRCLIGSGAIVLPAVKIGCDTVIGAGAVIVHDIPGNQVVTGNPGRSICAGG